MPSDTPSFTVGIEEEYLLVDRVSRDLAASPPPEMLAECERRLQGRVTPEFLPSADVPVHWQIGDRFAVATDGHVSYKPIVEREFT